MLYSIIGFVFTFVFFLTGGVFCIIYSREKPIEKLKYYGKSFDASSERQSKRKKSWNFLSLLSDFIPQGAIGKKRKQKIQLSLIQANIAITVEEFYVIRFFTIVGTIFLSFILSNSIPITTGLSIIVLYLPWIIISKCKNNRKKQFDEQINEGLMIIANSLKAGYSFLQASQAAAEETKEPFSTEFKRFLKQMNLGMPMEAALEGMMNRVESEDLKLIVNAILIQKDIGGNLSEILENISETIRERQKIQAELKTLTAQGKLSGMIIMSMPFFLGLVIYILNKEYILLLFHTQVGLYMVISALICQCLGLYMIRKIVHINL